MTDSDEERSDYPEYIQAAKFLRLGLDVDEELWPRDPEIYEPSQKFSGRVRQMKGVLTLDDINGTIIHGELYPAANACICFSRVVRGVAIYIITGAELKGDQELKARPSRNEFPDLQKEDFRYRAISLWPYVVNRESAWSMGWPAEVLDRIEEMAERRAY